MPTSSIRGCWPWRRPCGVSPAGAGSGLGRQPTSVGDQLVVTEKFENVNLAGALFVEISSTP
jgi:hypothetical protein